MVVMDMEFFQLVPGEVRNVGRVTARHDPVRVTRQQVVLTSFGKQLLRIALRVKTTLH